MKSWYPLIIVFSITCGINIYEHNISAATNAMAAIYFIWAYESGFMKRDKDTK